MSRHIVFNEKNFPFKISFPYAQSSKTSSSKLVVTWSNFPNFHEKSPPRSSDNSFCPKPSSLVNKCQSQSPSGTTSQSSFFPLQQESTHPINNNIPSQT